jgi:hypothetical protein
MRDAGSGQRLGCKRRVDYMRGPDPSAAPQDDREGISNSQQGISNVEVDSCRRRNDGGWLCVVLAGAAMSNIIKVVRKIAPYDEEAKGAVVGMSNCEC